MARRVLFGLILLCAVGCSIAGSEPNAKNELPFGWVDEPVPGTEVLRNMSAHGWALDDGSVAEVRIFLDDHFIARASVTEPRPDVTKVYPKYGHGNDTHGWSVTVPLGGGVTLGPHRLLFQAVDNQGATRDIGNVPVKLEH
jgi:hypothetical protein